MLMVFKRKFYHVGGNINKAEIFWNSAIMEENVDMGERVFSQAR
jgi:hypothetical protein